MNLALVMSCKVALLSKAHLTDRTREWLRLCVDSVMTLNTFFLCKSLATDRTMEWFLICVGSLMFFK
jgi:hypothetical protein